MSVKLDSGPATFIDLWDRFNSLIPRVGGRRELTEELIRANGFDPDGTAPYMIRQHLREAARFRRLMMHNLARAELKRLYDWIGERSGVAESQR